MAGPRILTFNFHEPYLRMLAKTGLRFTVGLYEKGPLAREWQVRSRSVPANMTLVEEAVWRRELAAGNYHLVIAHNEGNAADVSSADSRDTPALLVCHERKRHLDEGTSSGPGGEREAYAELLEKLQRRFQFVYVSESKRQSYSVPGTVILPGIDIDEFGGYRGDVAEVLRLNTAMGDGNHNRVADGEFQEQVCQGLPNRVLSDDPEAPGAAVVQSWEALLETYRSLRCMLHVTRDEWDDGYNLAMLEAMACGMPVVACGMPQVGLASRTSPLTDGLDGFVSDDPHVLHERLKLLLSDHHLARELGARGREAVVRQFPIGAFVQQWRQTIDEAAQRGSYSGMAVGEATGEAAGEVAVDDRFRIGVYYRAPRPELARHVPAGAQRVLDVGCGTGELGRFLKQGGVREVVGIEVLEPVWALAKKSLDDALLGNIEVMEIPYDDGYFDCIICGDVIEHLIDPIAALRKVARVLAPGGTIIISVPNVRFFQVVEMLANGRWKYEDAGIMDSTHLRFFTKIEIGLVVKAAGFELSRLEPLSFIAPEHLPLGPDRTVTLGRVTIKDVTDAEHEEFRTYQYLVVATKPKPPVLGDARQALEEGNPEQAYALAREAQDAAEVERQPIMAAAAARMGKLDEAETHYREALRLAPSDGELKGNLGILLIAKERPAEARPYLEEALAASPENGKVLGALGLACVLEGNADEAFHFFKASIELNLENEDLLNHLIQTAETLGRVEEAEEHVKRFVDFAPGNIGMTLRYVAILRQLGRGADARDRLETLLLLSPGHEEALEIMKEMDGESDEAP